MKLGLVVDYAGGFQQTAELLVEYERAGVDVIAIPEAYSFDAVSQLGYVAAKTKRVQLMSSVLPIYSRTPTLIAMTAAGLDSVSDGRFILGLGASGPQVIEGFHGVRYDRPLGRTREVVEICRQVWRRETLRHRGRDYRIPLAKEDGGTGLGKPLKLINNPARADIPISIAALGHKNVELAAEIAQGWQPGFFHPLKARAVWGTALDVGLARRARTLGALEIQVQVNFLLGQASPSEERKVRDQMALYLGGMGARGKNFYNELACRYGYRSAAEEIQARYLAGHKEAAALAVPSELIDAVTLIGDPTTVRRRVNEFAAAGVTTLLLNPLAATAEDRVAQVRDLVALVAGEAGG
ncbi:F420-dependent oxidoreductase-like protein [Tamaricihabitans halophyticus]|uniref:F420-dependent oxidoreductase-like protein n=1 Tax=Tamaricihabitans halophyticus TaxID=1262583 RepID=A0A4R2PYR7_9PSEU|nr:LLM class F420-dependent oxidoreductase [Tamaricihabitans halophyticus]TCP41247.1 F420-dependent oxidoreductase-like protein [Tamaricihabitans halophyticus]